MIDRRLTIALFAISILSTAAGCRSSEPSPASPAIEQVDKYLWLEDVHGERSIAWVKEQNARTAEVLQKDPRFADLNAAALKIYESPDRLPMPLLKAGTIYNLWQDAEHVRGIFRRTSLADYLTARPHWKTLIDYDQLARQAGVGRQRLELPVPGHRCLPGIALSRRRRC
jgi:prolyl oligopeptidase